MSQGLNIKDPVLKYKVFKMLAGIQLLKWQIRTSPLCQKKAIDKRLAQR